MPETVRVRFAPSPTGYLHVGGLRTALYNFLFARKHNGTFILRIEDTDRARYVEGAVENLIQTLRWAGLEFDEGPGKPGTAGPYIQSERLPIYREHAAKLVESGHAYYAFDTPEELEEIRRTKDKSGVLQKRFRRWLELSASEVQEKLRSGAPAVVRMKVPDGETVTVNDVIRGEVQFSSDLLDDQVLLKSDGFPTYHLAVVVDDHLMRVTHVIRGEEWLPSTPKHVLLYRYFGWDLPVFAHLPLLLNPDKSKLSKRQGDVAVEEYRAKGFLPEALVNFVALLGWNPGTEQEIFSLQELMKAFSLERVGKSGAVFNIDKLNSINSIHLRGRQDSQTIKLDMLKAVLDQKGWKGFSDTYLQSVIALMKERVERVEDFAKDAVYFFEDPVTYEEQSRTKNWKEGTSANLQKVKTRLQQLDKFDHAGIEEAVRSTAGSLSMGAGQLIHPLRLAITGVSKGPGLFELMAVLGKETSLRRIDRACALLG